jgi:hypothetical protein
MAKYKKTSHHKSGQAHFATPEVTVRSPLLVTTPERGNARFASLVQANAERRKLRSNAEHWNEGNEKAILFEEHCGFDTLSELT